FIGPADQRGPAIARGGRAQARSGRTAVSPVLGDLEAEGAAVIGAAQADVATGPETADGFAGRIQALQAESADGGRRICDRVVGGGRAIGGEHPRAAAGQAGAEGAERIRRQARRNLLRSEPERAEPAAQADMAACLDAAAKAV